MSVCSFKGERKLEEGFKGELIFGVRGEMDMLIAMIRNWKMQDNKMNGS